MKNEILNLFSRSSVGKKISYVGDVFEDIEVSETFCVTDNVADTVYEIGYGVSSVNLESDDHHITIRGSSRTINSLFEEFHEESKTVMIEQVIVRGNDGREGSQGSVGPKGSQGEKGEKGETGLPGRDGKEGSEGQRGPAGGAAGPEGPQGPQGEQGPRGIQGMQGEKSKDGKDGKDGVSIQGERGRDGEDGRDGSNGLDGSDGVQGVQGKEGLQGVVGERGEPGSKGENGRNGSQGKVGPKGRDGKDGKSGNDGKDGKDGKDGEKGEKGDDGIVKVQGPLKYNRSEKILTVSEDWINSLGSQIQGAAILGGGGDLLGVKQNGQSIRGADAVRYINFSGSGITVSSNGNVAKVDISTTTQSQGIQSSGGNNIMQQFLDMNGFDLYNSRIDGGTF